MQLLDKLQNTTKTAKKEKNFFSAIGYNERQLSQMI
jgi:hypothetical protein